MWKADQFTKITIGKWIQKINDFCLSLFTNVLCFYSLLNSDQAATKELTWCNQEIFQSTSSDHSAVLLVSNKCCTLWVYQTDLWIVLRLGLRFDRKENISFFNGVSGCPATIFHPRNVSTSPRDFSRHSRKIETTKLFVQQVTILGTFSWQLNF